MKMRRKSIAWATNTARKGFLIIFQISYGLYVDRFAKRKVMFFKTSRNKPTKLSRNKKKSKIYKKSLN